MAQKQDTIDMFKMTSYDSVQQMAGFTYISETNQVKTISISKMVFKALMSEESWDQKKFGQILAPQFELRSCLRNYGKDIINWNSWFEDKSNNLIRESTSTRIR